MFVEICSDCVMDNAGYDEAELGRSYSTEYRPMSLLPMSSGYIVTVTDCGGLRVLDNACEGHFSNQRCDGCGEPLAGSRFCHSAFQMK
jgi:hypothetical protein